MVTDYQIALIIITIIGFIITTAFYFYFVYLPADRAEQQLDTIISNSSDLITLANQKVIQIEDETMQSLISVCESIKELICAYNKAFGCIATCILNKEAYPEFCNQLVPFDTTNVCTACGL